MLCKKDASQKFTIPGGTDGRLYPSSPNGDQTIAYVEMNGFYPEKGYSLNDICTETLFLIEGSIEIEVNEVWNKLSSGDIFMILPGNKYRIRGNGKTLDLITPAWDKKQNHIIEQ